MSLGGAMLALSAVQSISQIGQGSAIKAEANANATLIEGKAGLIDIQKGIEKDQYTRQKGQVASQSVASTAGAGLMLSGSKLAIMLDTQKQLELDQAIGQFNFDQQKRFTLAEADSVRRTGAMAKKQANANAFSTALKGAYQYQRTSVGTLKDSTFDTVLTKG